MSDGQSNEQIESLLSDDMRIILGQLTDKHFISAFDLATHNQFSISRVRLAIKALKKQGVSIHAITGKGYRIDKTILLLDKKTILENLSDKTRLQLSSLEILDRVDSTSLFLGRKLHEPCGEAISGHVCLAEMQTAGRGRSGRTWISPFGRNVYLSIRWHFGTATFSGLSLAVGVVIVKILRAQGMADVGLKWPNDLYWRDQKLGGILIDVTGEANSGYSVIVGIGLNISMPTAAACAIDQPWTDLERIDGNKTLNRNELVTKLLDGLFPVLATYEISGFSPYLAEWNAYHLYMGRSVRLIHAETVIEGKVSGINSDGLLLLESRDGLINAYASGEVSLRVSRE